MRPRVRTTLEIRGVDLDLDAIGLRDGRRPLMAVSDALVVGEDWISEHYFTTDTAKESFLARVLERRKEWEALEKPADPGAPPTPTPRSRFRAEIMRCVTSPSVVQKTKPSVSTSSQPAICKPLPPHRGKHRGERNVRLLRAPRGHIEAQHPLTHQ